jgi:hypothetical protein
MFGNGVFKIIIELQRERKWQEARENCIIRNFIIVLHQILLEFIVKEHGLCWAYAV